MDFTKRFKTLNDRQKEAVTAIDGPVMVIAGPGTGKTELLSMRAANILRETDTLPNNLLCLTFTESGAAAMRERLVSIIGQDAYKVAIHTFHSFGSDVIARYGEYFYQGADVRPADEISTYEILRGIFEELPHSSPLAGQFGGDFTYLSDTAKTISELKKSGLTSDELLVVLDDNERVLDTAEPVLTELFANRISKSMLPRLSAIATTIAELEPRSLPSSITPLASTLALSIAHAVDAAIDLESTKPITAWRNKWLEKNAKDEFVFKDRKRQARLRAVSNVYFQYLSRMQERHLYDFDDMVLRVLHATEVFDDLRYSLQEQYLYIMVDEFQDTNLAQMRLLSALTSNPTNEGAPNLMVVGDDDQAIYSFQGAEISNILDFSSRYESVKRITLVDNYRSTPEVLTAAREVITQGSERLESYLTDLDKTLTAHLPSGTAVRLIETATPDSERAWLARHIKEMIKSGTSAQDIAVLTRRHNELEALLPYFTAEEVTVQYERRDNILENELIIQLSLLSRIIHSLAVGQHEDANTLLPELLAHPAWNFSSETLWKLSLKAHHDRAYWMEAMSEMTEFLPLRTWLLDMAQQSLVSPLEVMLDQLVGSSETDGTDAFISPYHGYFFTREKRDTASSSYLEFLEALRTLRHELRTYKNGNDIKLADFLDFLTVHQQLGSTISSVRVSGSDNEVAIHLMTAHKSKGLEFDHIFIVGAVDSKWGRQVRSRSRLISYPENLPLMPAGDTYDERLRLFFVAMTRAKKSLTITHASADESGSALSLPEFLVGNSWTVETVEESSVEQQVRDAKIAWYQPLITPLEPSMKQLLTSTLERYKLSATHLCNFLDITHGGPEHFLLSNLLRFPEAMSPDAVYGSAIHACLQQAHAHLITTEHQRPIEDSLQDFEHFLARGSLDKDTFSRYLERGSNALTTFLGAKGDSFTTTQRPELGFAGQQSYIDDTHLTGTLDLVDIDHEAKTIIVTDYKTGRPSHSWKGRSDGEKLKLHKYRHQLLFYKVLVENSRDWSAYTVTHGRLQFVEPDEQGDIVALELEFDSEEVASIKRLIRTVWKHIIALDLPDVSSYSPTYRGVLDFERALLDEE